MDGLSPKESERSLTVFDEKHLDEKVSLWRYDGLLVVFKALLDLERLGSGLNKHCELREISIGSLRVDLRIEAKLAKHLGPLVEERILYSHAKLEHKRVVSILLAHEAVMNQRVAIVASAVKYGYLGVDGCQ